LASSRTAEVSAAAAGIARSAALASKPAVKVKVFQVMMVS
jgi:hypothetical protein